MRPVDKGTAPRVYDVYGDAKHDLATRIGYYCSYCEMSIIHMGEVEHVIPKTHWAAGELEWGNFLLSCKFCNNSPLKKRNTSRNGYYWPDNDNTFLALSYSEQYTVRPNPNLTNAKTTIAQATIDLTGIDKFPGNPNGKEPTLADTRWRSRFQAWQFAKDSYNDWNNNPTQEIVNTIVRIASGHGHFSIWMTVFNNVPVVKNAIIAAFPNTARDCFDNNGNPVNRPNGSI